MVMSMKFIERLKKETAKRCNTVIPDIKCFSPKEGDLLRGRDPVEVAVSLAEAGAPALSVVTEPEAFKGSMELLTRIAKATHLPILRKDFIHTKEDLIATKESGASAILLICSCLSKEELFYLYYTAVKMGLDPLVEAHSFEELSFANELGAQLVGINNRNILELERDDGDISLTSRMAAYAPKGALLISESSISSPEEVRSAIRAGADCTLVGTAIWQAEKPWLFYKMLCSPVSVKICGLRSPEDVLICVDNGVEILGFVTEYPKHVPWNLTKEETRKLVGMVSSPNKTCIVTGGKPDDVISLANDLRPNMVQLHYHETLEDTKLIAEKLQEIGIETIKTLPISAKEQMLQFGTTNIGHIIEELCETKVAALLVDAREASNASETGLKIDNQTFMRIKELSSKRLILAGGITPENITDILRETGAEYIDIMTGVEKTTGVKDEGKIELIMRTVHNG
jgi:indole-3-glycerol phosphate synthase/phosphoribosylanthranilate isomerase